MKEKRALLFVLVCVLTIVFSMPVHAAASFKTVTDKKKAFGSYYVWRPYNTEFYIQKKGSGKIKKLSKPVYTVCGTTNGSVLYFTALGGKFSGEVTLYKYNLKTGKQKKISIIRNALHINGCCRGCVYGNGASVYDGRPNNKIYSFNIKTGKKKTILKNAWLEKANGRYLYVDRNGTHYRYNVVTKKLKRSNWQK